MRRAVLVLLVSTRCAAAPAVREGDIVFHTSRSSQSAAIQKATRSRYSHMGIVFVRDGRPQVFEAVGTVSSTPLARWIARGDGGHFVVKRLKDPKVLTPDALAKLRRAADAYKGKRYDLTFEWSDDRIYCSELVWKMYRDALGLEVGAQRKLRDFDLDVPVVKAKLRERYGARVPLDETVVSPQDVFASPLLETVIEE